VLKEKPILQDTGSIAPRVCKNSLEVFMFLVEFLNVIKSQDFGL